VEESRLNSMLALSHIYLLNGIGPRLGLPSKLLCALRGRGENELQVDRQLKGPRSDSNKMASMT